MAKRCSFVGFIFPYNSSITLFQHASHAEFCAPLSFVVSSLSLLPETPEEGVSYYILFFIQVGTRKVNIAGLTPNPNVAWMTQIARNSTIPQWDFLTPGNCLIHDRLQFSMPPFRRPFKPQVSEPSNSPPAVPI